MTAHAVDIPLPSGRTATGVLAGLFGLVLALLLLFAVAAQQAALTPSGDGLNTAKIPAAYVAWVIRAGSMCAAITSMIIAGQAQTESGWNARAYNASSGAEGMEQFLPATWQQWGRNDDGTGNVSPYNPRDAIMAAGRYDCYLAGQAQHLIAAGQAIGNVTSLALAAYNAGLGQVEEAHGIPPIPQTIAYVQKIETLASTVYSVAVSGAGSTAGRIAVAAAESALGTPYQWGGSCTDPHGTNPAGHCDCSSLVQMAWRAAGVSLPRTTFEQVHAGTPVASVSQLQAGDLIFTPGSDGTAANPGHVGMYTGNDSVINAPQTGEVVRIDPLASWLSSIVAMRHIE
jgi:cell wall-associated NlpC family hydrolase